jgi:hypothetical protein
MSYVGDYWLAVDDGGVVAYGKCIEQRGNLVVLDNGDNETIIHTNFFTMQRYTYAKLKLTLKKRSDDT